jgi:cob(I)alamin adenosyltransferase
MAKRKSLYTKYGDTGTTSLLYGGRVSKSDLQCEAYGAIDEAVSALGLARALSADLIIQKTLKDIEIDLFTVGAELATDPNNYQKFKKYFRPVTAEMTHHVETLIDDFQAKIDLPRSFIIPGGSTASAAIDLGRSTIRRAERNTVRLAEHSKVANLEILKYLNRVGDLLFIIARYQDRDTLMEKLSDKNPRVQ